MIKSSYWRNLAIVGGSLWVWCMGMVLAFVVPPIETPIDLQVYIDAASGDLTGWLYPEWLRWLFVPLTVLPPVAVTGVWLALTIGCIIYAAHIFKQKQWLPLLTFQALWLVYYGQIGGLIAGAFAWYWHHLPERPYLAGVGACIACAKPQWGVPLLIIMALVRVDTWLPRIRSTVPLLMVFVASLIVSPTWMMDVLQTINTRPVEGIGIVSLWEYTGVWGLLLWVPALFAQRRLSAIDTTALLTATLVLTVPVFRQSDLVLLYAMPVGLAPLLGWVGALGVSYYPYVAMAPMTIYSWLLYKGFSDDNV